MFVAYHDAESSPKAGLRRVAFTCAVFLALKRNGWGLWDTSEPSTLIAKDWSGVHTKSLVRIV